MGNAERAFRFAIEGLNAAPYSNGSRIVADTRYVAGNNSFEATKTVCRQLARGVAAVFGPASMESSTTVGSVCKSMDVPFVETRWEYQERGSMVTSINLHPNNRHISRAIRDLVYYYRWTAVTIIYQEDTGLTRLQEVLRASAQRKIKLTVYRLPRQLDMRALLKEIKTSGARHIIIDCRSETLLPLLEQIMEVQMLRSYYHFLFTSMDISLLNMSRYSGDGVNLTALHLCDWASHVFHKVTAEWRAKYHRSVYDNPMDHGLTMEAALMYDAVHVVAKALVSMGTSRNMTVQNLSCFHEQLKSWDDGRSFYNYLKSVEIKDGLTGHIAFGNYGERDRPKIFISELSDSNGMEQRGYWNLEHGVYLKPRDEKLITENVSSINRSLIVTTILEQPYIMRMDTKDGKVLTGNDRYYGYCIDMLQEIAKIVGFRYEIVEVDDNNYGSPNDDGIWSGMVGKLVERKADLAVAPLTITYSREQVVDFSKPYMHLGITILYRSPEPQNPGVFSFLNPLSFDVWLYVVIAFFLVSITLFLLARFSPYEWYNSHPCNPEYDEIENQFNLTNCLWFAFGGLMQQGSEVNPRAFSTRVLSGFWWFFSLILVSSYTANLAAFLTVERMVSPISSADDLAKQTEIEYGTRSGGSTETFFRRSKIPTYQTMYEFMSARPNVLSETYDEGIERVLNSKNYAFLLESTTAEYRISQHCKNLTLIGGLLNSRGYGIGTPLGSAIRDEITKAILILQEDDTLLRLKQKWWKTENCPSNINQKEDASELGVKNIGGIFLVLISGLIAGTMAAVAEFVWKSRQNATLDRKSLCGEMMAELRFACRCNRRRNSKPVIEHKYMPTVPYPTPTINGQAIQMTETVA